MAADIAAVDRGEVVRVFGYFRASYGNYPRRFRGYLMDLTQGGIILHTLFILDRLRRRPTRVPERVLSAQVRPFESEQEARSMQATGLFAPGGRLEWAGFQVISCRTAQGTLEFAVKRPDVALFLHFLPAHPSDARPSPDE